MTDTANANDIIMKGLSNETEGLGRFGHHPNPAIDFCIEVETLESRLHQAEHGLSKPRSVPETIAAVLHDIQKALNFRVGGDEGAVSAKHLLRSLEDKAKSLILTDTASAPERTIGIDLGGPDTTVKVELVNRTHCDELVAAAYLDARDSINEYPRVAPEADEANAYDEQIEHCQGIIDARTPDNARAALTAYGERMKSEGALEAQAKIEKLEALADALRQVSSFNGYTNDGRVSITTVPETKTVHFTAADMAEAQAKIARMEASLEILRDNPAAVHLNMLKGNIAKPTWEQIKHLYRAEFNLLQEDDDE